MCGIVGHLGPRNSVNVVLEGLKRLEYRGYDSAGISLVNENNQLKVFKKTGKLENLQNLLEGESLVARSCIGHTRWATHGQVNDTNSHPHSHGEISIVHNGIIENAADLRGELEKKGFEFKSETDTEVYLGLLVTFLKEGQKLREAVYSAFHKVEGNSAFVIQDAASSDIYSIKKGAPLVCGTNLVNSEALLSSDPYALVGVADEIFFPEDGVLCFLSSSNKGLIAFSEEDGSASKRFKRKKQDMSLDVSDRGEFEHFMLKEIHEQPELIRSLTSYYFSENGEQALKKVSTLKPEGIHISACGTAFYAGMVIKNFLEQRNHISSQVDLASEFRYRNPLINSNEMGLFVSQSGETADTLAAQELCREKGMKTLSIVNVEGSSLFRSCDENLLIRAGVEIGVASTKAFTQQVLTGYLMSFALAGDFSSEKKKDLSDKFTLLANRIEQLLERSEEIKEIAHAIYLNKGFFFTGRGMYYPVALEGALKLKEIAYVHAEGYASGELKHGPLALIDENMVNIAIVGPELYEKTVSNIEEIKARKGIIVSLGPEGDKNLEAISDYYLPLNFEGLDDLSPLYVNAANQLLSYYMAKFKGTDIDKPRNLAKSVTVE